MSDCGNRFTLEQVREPGCLLLDVVTGSRAYGLATETSDTDLKGIFAQPMLRWFGSQRWDRV